MRTIHRRLHDYSLSIGAQHSTTSDDALVLDIKAEFPTAGYTLMTSHLLSRGQRVQQRRVRETLVSTDPDGITTRWCYSIQRHRYNVYAPLALWHIDGLHKLIRSVNCRFSASQLLPGFNLDIIMS